MSVRTRSKITITLYDADTGEELVNVSVPDAAVPDVGETIEVRRSHHLDHREDRQHAGVVTSREFYVEEQHKARETKRWTSVYLYVDREGGE